MKEPLISNYNPFLITWDDIENRQFILEEDDDDQKYLELKRDDLALFKEEIVYITENHPCDSNELHKLSQVINNLNTTEAANMLTCEFYNPFVMHNTQCLIENIFYTAPWDKAFTPEERKRLHIKNVMLISDNTASSTAYIAKYNNQRNFNIVIKQGLNTFDSFSLAHETFIGLYAINKLRSFCPNFMYTYGIVFEDKFINRSDTSVSLMPNENNKTSAYLDQENKKIFHILLESIYYAIPLAKYIDVAKDEYFVNIFMQIVYALEIAQHEIAFTHYDLHAANVLVKKSPLDSQIVYHRPNGQKRYVKSEYIAIIIDFGYSHVNVDDKDYGISRNKVFATNNKLHPLYDIYKILGYASAHYLEKIRQSGGSNKKTEFMFETMWNIFNPTQNWKEIVMEQSEIGYVYYKEVDENPLLYSQFIDLVEEKLNNPYAKNLDVSNLDCNDNRCHTSDEIWQLENLNTFTTIPKDIISMYDLYFYLNNENNQELANEILQKFIQTNDFIKSYNNTLVHVNKLLIKSLDEKYNYFSAIPQFNKEDFITYRTIYNNSIFRYLEYLHILNEIKFNINVLDKFKDFISKEQEIRDIVSAYEHSLKLTKEMAIFFKELYDNFITFDKNTQQINYPFIKNNLILIRNLSLM